MSQVMTYTFRLFGPNKGRTMVVNGHKFVNGEYRNVFSVNSAASVMKVLGYYGAYAKGTPEYDVELLKEQGNGSSEVHKTNESRKTVSFQSGRESNGTRPSYKTTNDGSGDAENSKGDTGSSADGVGHSDTGIPKFEEPENWPRPSEPASLTDAEVKKAILKLDPSNDKHWVKAGPDKGKPKLAAVEEAFGKAGLTRQDLESALPAWNRDKAMEAVLEG